MPKSTLITDVTGLPLLVEYEQDTTDITRMMWVREEPPAHLHRYQVSGYAQLMCEDELTFEMDVVVEFIAINRDADIMAAATAAVMKEVASKLPFHIEKRVPGTHLRMGPIADLGEAQE